MDHRSDLPPETGNPECGQPALPRRTGLRAMPIALASAIIIISAVISLLVLRGRPGDGALPASDAIRPNVVGMAEGAGSPDGQRAGDVLSVSPTPSAASGGDEAADGTLSLKEIYRKNIDAVVCVQAMGASGTSTGTGVILSSDGYLITNYHVIEGMASYVIVLSDDSQYEAALVGSDELTDLAVLKIEAAGLTAAEFGDSESLEVGESVVAIGNPLGMKLRGTMTNGIVSAINRDIVIDGREMTVIQTNAALNSGSSGGPLLNAYGQVVGINTAKFSAYAYEPVEGIGFAIPTATVIPIVEELISRGYVSGRPTLGLTCESVPQYAKIYYRLPDGVFVTAIDENSDAYAKGIREGDILIALGSTRITSAESYSAALGLLQVGATVTVTIYHGGAYYYVDLQLAEQGAG